MVAGLGQLLRGQCCCSASPVSGIDFEVLVGLSTTEIHLFVIFSFGKGNEKMCIARKH